MGPGDYHSAGAGNSEGLRPKGQPPEGGGLSPWVECRARSHVPGTCRAPAGLPILSRSTPLRRGSRARGRD
jgi:hypothetical protein